MGFHSQTMNAPWSSAAKSMLPGNTKSHVPCNITLIKRKFYAYDLMFIVIIIIIELLQLPKNRDQSNRNTFTRFLKRCLQCTENMESLSSTTKNRCDECSTAAKMLVECVEHYYAKRCEVVS
ncbi:unnamed protein product [Porites lobata]|uniref:Uncharacterized protein n=1 Tax=Porites lobata TaxID=104759 RepID=A0ABN8NUG5_9CNID|nr:unnamed protein product [Porites lobata]